VAKGGAAFGLNEAWAAVLAYTLQLYFDFSGYSDMAIGLGHMFGFRFPENFRYPYVATSVQEFWKRWHISLSTWFRDYLYIPLGGNRRTPARVYLNLTTVFSSAVCGTARRGRS
jgi:alginate O-acetyltransferase complex protein AlgI